MTRTQDSIGWRVEVSVAEIVTPVIDEDGDVCDWQTIAEFTPFSEEA